jgi:hypothetical protein
VVVLRTSAPHAAAWRAARRGALLLISLTVAHDLIYRARYDWAYSQGEVDGHGYWPLMILLTITAFAAITFRSVRRLAAASSDAQGQPEEQSFSASTAASEFRALLVGLLPRVVAAYVVLENVEHLLNHGHVEGIDVLFGPGNELVLPIIAAVASALSLLGALVRWRERILVAQARRLRALNVRYRHTRTAPPTRWVVTGALIRLRLLLAPHDVGRAPPAASLI